jgi:hypothetical protein
MVTWLARDIGKIPVTHSAKYFGRSGVTLILGLNRLDELMASELGLRRSLTRTRARLLAGR